MKMHLQNQHIWAPVEKPREEERLRDASVIQAGQPRKYWTAYTGPKDEL